MASPVSCLYEETQQNHRIRTRPNRLVVSQWGHHSAGDKAAQQKTMQGTGLPEAFEIREEGYLR